MVERRADATMQAGFAGSAPGRLLLAQALANALRQRRARMPKRARTMATAASSRRSATPRGYPLWAGYPFAATKRRRFARSPAIEAQARRKKTAGNANPGLCAAPRRCAGGLAQPDSGRARAGLSSPPRRPGLARRGIAPILAALSGGDVTRT